MISSNFTHVSLLFNNTIIVKNDTDTYVFNMPSIDFENSTAYNFNFFLGCCASEITLLQKQLPTIHFESKYELMLTLCKSQTSEAIDVLACLSYCIQDFEYVEDSFWCGKTLITDEIFDLFCDYISIACGYNAWDLLESKRKFSEMSEWEQEWERKKREHDAKIRAAKAKEGKGVGLDIVVASIMREFGLSIDEIKHMNKYGVYFLFSQVGKIANYEVTKIAAGTGNLGKSVKHQYWANQK